MTGISSRTVLAIVAALAIAGAAALAVTGPLAPGAASGTTAFAWLRPSHLPRSWHTAKLPGGPARLPYPGGWHSIESDPGTRSAAIRSRTGKIQGYLNATPQQGDETLANWSSFRPDHNRDEGDVNVTPVASATNLAFRGAHGSCLIDGYTSSTGHRYREIACIVAGSHATTVVVGAAPPRDWHRERPALERSISAFQT